MKPIRDALELFTAQHEEIDGLLAQVQQTRDAHALGLLVDKLVAHLALEQELFYPIVAPTIGDDILAELLQEHVAIKRALAELVWLGVDAPDVATPLEQLGVLLAGHVSWQEDQLFILAAESMTADELASLGHRLQTFELELALAA